MTEITIEIANPRDRGQWIKLHVIADTGAIFSVLPRNTLEGLGIAPYREKTFYLADGRDIHRQLGDVFLRINGEEETVPAIFGEPTDTPLLGVTALEILGFIVNPSTQKLESTKMLLL